MKRADEPLTLSEMRREMARLFRAFATMLEVRASSEEEPAAPRRRRPRTPSIVPSEKATATAKAAMKRLGMVA